jgi:predicted metal-dependent enzyme (double-stranded beta helix superfamily)
MYVPALPSAAIVAGGPAPTHDPIQLVECTRMVAARVLAGHYPFISFDPDQRWHRRIHHDRNIDIWLISWLPSQGTELHDHGGSAGALTVVRGELAEACYVGHGERTGALHERRHPAGRSIGFGSRHIHDVRNLSDDPAVSVHAYSRPLALMNYYALSGRGRLRTVDSVTTTDPEEGRWAS